ncbi:MAG: hypothetical protein ACRCTZ_00870 [Sarcina sp.]
MDINELGKKLKEITDEYLRKSTSAGYDEKALLNIDKKRDELILRISNRAYNEGKVLNLQGISNGSIRFNNDDSKNVMYLKESVTTFIDKSILELSKIKVEIDKVVKKQIESLPANYFEESYDELFEENYSSLRKKFGEKINSRYFFKVKEILSVFSLDPELYLSYKYEPQGHVISKRYNKIEDKVEEVAEIIDELTTVKKTINKLR